MFINCNEIHFIISVVFKIDMSSFLIVLKFNLRFVCYLVLYLMFFSNYRRRPLQRGIVKRKDHFDVDIARVGLRFGKNWPSISALMAITSVTHVVKVL